MKAKSPSPKPANKPATKREFANALAILASTPATTTGRINSKRPALLTKGPRRGK